MRANRILGLAGWLFLVGIAAALGALASVDAATFYRSLDLPSWAPPAALFGPVWTALYVAMAVAAWLVWSARGWPGAWFALSVFCAQLVANALWSWLFFAWRAGAPSVADIAVLWVMVVVTLIAFFRVRRVAGLLMVPYLAWVTFAAFLNIAVWQRNPAMFG
jgi:tryptophan-rich sensory protein